jgi:fumarate hydratase class I
MLDLTDALIELVRITATDLPPDVESRLQNALENELPGSAAHGALEAILKNVQLARENSTPICQDTGTPIFYVDYPVSWSTRALRTQIETAVAAATEKAYLRPNSVHSITGKNSGNNLGDHHFPSIHFNEIDGENLIIHLMLKGGGCENVGAQYSLPNTSLSAGRDLEGVRKVALDAVQNAQGKGCAPGILGISIGGDRGSSYLASKEVLIGRMGESSPDKQLAFLEDRLTDEANQLGIGPMGFGGETTVLDTKITSLHRLPASYFVTVSYMCWAYRRRSMLVENGSISYK